MPIEALLRALERLHIEHRVFTSYHVRCFLPDLTVDVWPTKNKFIRLGKDEKATTFYNLEKLLIDLYIETLESGRGMCHSMWT